MAQTGHYVIESYILQGLSVFLLSLWKIWLGPTLSVTYGLSFREMIGWSISGAMLSAAVTLHFSRDINALIRRLSPNRETKPRSRKELRRYVRFWRRYGFYGVMLLSPVLVGIPLGAWISARLGTPKPKILLMLGIFSVLWSSVLYQLARFGIAFF